MNNIEKEYNKRFSNQELPSGDFDTDGLWDAVSENLGTIPPPSSPKPWWSTKLFGGLAVSAVVGTMFLCYQIGANNLFSSNSIDEKETIEKIINIDKKTKNTNSSLIPTNSAAVTSPPNLSHNESLNTIQEINFLESVDESLLQSKTKTVIISGNSITEKKFEIHKLGNFQSQNSSIGSTIIIRENIEPPILKSRLELASDEGINKPGQASILPNTENQSDSKNEAVLGLTLKSLPALSTILISNDSEKELPKTYYPNNEIDKRKPKTTDWQIGLYGGVNNFCFDYSYSDSLSLGEEKDLTDTGQWGYNIGFKTSLIINDLWVISSGLEYQNLYSRFDFTRVSNSSVLKEDEVIKIFLDSATGDTLNVVTGDAFVEAANTQTIVHYNRYQQFTVPLQIGFQNNFKRFIYGVEAGASLNFVTAQSGRTLDLSGDVVDFDEDSAYTPFRSVHIGFRFSPLIGYQFSDKWAILFQPQYAWNPHIGFKNSRLQLSTRQLNFMVGVGYSL